MFRANHWGRNAVPALFLVGVLILGVSGCGGGQPDRAPAFEQDSLAGKIYDQNLPISGETLPEAAGGDGVLNYSITPELPEGLTFDPATRLLSGTPSEAQEAILYTYMATDSDAANPDSASLVFAITVNVDPVPVFEGAAIAGKTYVQNLPIDGETLPAASGGDGLLTYAITPELPAGLSFNAATRVLSGTPAGAQAASAYTYTATDSDAVHPDSASLVFRITVNPDLAPAFETSGIAGKVYDQNLPIGSETLPGATGGDGLLTYALTPDLPAGLTFDPASRLLSGTPIEARAAAAYTYTATDSDAVDPDTASLVFELTVREDPVPVFETSSIADKSYERGEAIDGETLPGAYGGNGPLTYALSPKLPAGLVFDAATRRLSGTPTRAQAETLYTYTVTDSDPIGPDSVSLTFSIAVEATALVHISAAAAEMDEGDDLTPVRVTLTLSEPVTGPVIVALASTGTARLGSDFDLADAAIFITEGETRATTAITPIRDLEAEHDESITLEIDGVGGRVEVGSPSSVRVAIRDLGTRPADEFAVLNTILRVWGGESYHIGTDALYLYYSVWNSGLVATSPTQALLFTTPDLFSEDAPFERLAVRPVPALEPGGSWFSDTVRIPFEALIRGSNNYFVLVVRSVAEEDPYLVDNNLAGDVDYSTVFLTEENRIPTTCTGFERGSQPGIADPLFAQQWALRNTGQAAFADSGGTAGEDLNMEMTLAGGPTGAGVKVAVPDSGLEICHPDLADNVEAGLSYNFNAAVWHGAKVDDPFLPTVLGDHGTSVAGLIAATADNGVGGRGVAPDARLRGFNFLSFPVDAAYYDSLGMSSRSPRSDDVHVFNLSFGSAAGASNLSADERELFRVGASDLRGGRGALYVKAAGNAFERCTKLDEDDMPLAPRLDLSAEIGCTSANQDGGNNVPYVIVTGGFNADGKRSSYSSAGASLWVAAPAGQFGADRPALITTDQMGAERGYGLIPRGLAAGDAGNPLGDYTSIFNGTSAAAPNASGVVALLLETQPELTWRDVKHILARTARQLDADIPRVRVAFGGAPAVLRHGWITNGAGYPFHNWYGFGAIDVDAAVALAAAHAPDSLGVFTVSAPIRHAFRHRIPDHDGGGVTQTRNVSGLSRTANIEAVQLRIEVTHARPRELGIELTSPAGTRSIVNPVFNHALNGADNPLDWTILSNAFYGEAPTGEWTLNVIDVAEGNTGTLDAWSLIFYLGEHPEDL